MRKRKAQLNSLSSSQFAVIYGLQLAKGVGEGDHLLDAERAELLSLLRSNSAHLTAECMYILPEGCREYVRITDKVAPFPRVVLNVYSKAR
jgi:hypothetical protein